MIQKPYKYVILEAPEEAKELGADYIDYQYIIDCYSDVDRYMIYRNGNHYPSIDKTLSIEEVLKKLKLEE